MTAFKRDTVGQRSLLIDRYGVAEPFTAPGIVVPVSLQDAAGAIGTVSVVATPSPGIYNFRTKKIRATGTTTVSQTATDITIDSGSTDVTLSSAGGTSLITDGTGPSLTILGLVASGFLTTSVTGTTLSLDNICMRMRDGSGNSPPTTEGSTASGTRSIAHGLSCTATGTNSVSYGILSDATAQAAVAIGNNCDATAQDAASVGRACLASGIAGAAVGSTNTAQTAGSVAVGSGNTSNNTDGVAMGRNNLCGGNNASAIGVANQANANTSIALGYNNVVSSTNASAIGDGLTNATSDTMILGCNATIYARLSSRGSVTQITNNNTNVTLNSAIGTVIMFGSIAAGGTASFTITNSFCQAASTVICQMRSTGTVILNTTSIAAGSFAVNMLNPGAGAANNPRVEFIILHPL